MKNIIKKLVKDLDENEGIILGDDILTYVDRAIHQARAEERKRVVGIVDNKVKEYHKDCLTDMFINGEFWAYKEMQGLLSSLDKPKCVCGEQDILDGAEVEIGGVCHRPKNPCYIIEPLTDKE